ncbi:carotenoid ester lipase precursor [Beauveria bassiana ARSEF 2860]|uniref:Carboxylic ester hydrolase n=1 Tax=Beauveria bassiana (strain ARSEF 2860) TaxID=655819 RepID=J4KQ23_BEAB2|nr:carotenoid ester lipase precursor [Beauveria bassiana ARSEF 2860]EJP68454.1 carotenoid ester lipase precursor [Beauveria bassiana ARSEF 2860]
MVLLLYSTSLLTFWLLLAAASAAPASRSSPQVPPVVKIKNGTIQGHHNPHYDQDFFLGIPFASPPVANLRFKLPAPAKGWNGTRVADSYGLWCMGNSVGLVGFSQNSLATESEDCLYLNIVRPAGLPSNTSLPVLVWFHGGGFEEGSAADQRYNGSFPVKTAVGMGSPIIFVSFNYRLGVWGSISGPPIEEAGLANIFMHDQRQALAWVQENIAHFGGDPSKVTVMGESAGSISIGYQLLAYGGRDDGLFRAAIAESGGPLYMGAPLRNASQRATDFELVLNTTGCSCAADALGCLRQAPTASINQASNIVPFYPTVDGDFLPHHSMALLQQNRFLKVPLLTGSNRNEGATFTQLRMTKPFDTDDDFAQFVRACLQGWSIDNSTIQNWARLYQEEVDTPSVAGLGTVSPNPGPSFGSGYGKATLWLGDMMFSAGRRLANQKWAENNIATYGYFFDTVTNNVDASTSGAAHFQEIPYVFGNTQGVGWHLNPFPEDPILRKKHEKLATVMSRMWISFVVTGSPNFHKGKVLRKRSEP